MNMKNLSSINHQEFNEFINSFDYIIYNIDSPFWFSRQNISDINSLKKCGKKIIFLSNNCTKTVDQALKAMDIGFEQDDLITPALAMISHLKKLNFNKEIYVLGTSELKQELKDAGFKIAYNEFSETNLSVGELIKFVVTPNENIGAVIVGADPEFSWIKLQKAVTYLNKQNTLFISGSEVDSDSLNDIKIDSRDFHKILESMTGRKSYSFAKLDVGLNKYIEEKLKIQDRSRVLFIHDSISENIKSASQCGYKNLIILNGTSAKAFENNNKFSEEYKGHYCLDNLKHIHQLITQNSPNS